MRGCPLRAGAGRRRGYAGRYDDSRRCDAYSGRAEINIVCRPFGPCRRACGCAGLFFFAGGLRCPVCLRRIALCPVFLPVFRLSLAGPCLPLPVSLSARISPALSGRPPSSVFRLVFFCHFLFFRSSSIARRLLSVARSRRPSSSACRLLSVAHCLSLAAHCPSLAARCP